ncbi:Protein of unknown function [Candidatus Aquiluna sp. UB-MaderosW2red]|nr:Protein of unknown function [Candidatus Aquiluna sp. UB-MaderosW2red]
MEVKTQAYRERLYPSISMLLGLSLSAPMVLLAALPLGLGPSIFLALCVTSLIIYGSFYFSPVVTLDRRLTARRLSLPLEILGSVTVYEDADEVRMQLGPSLNANAKLAIRGDIPKLVKIEIIDPLDPTPYVLISTRQPEQLASALRANLSSS